MRPRRVVCAPSALPDSANLYAQYTALDLSTLPFHTGTGAWGAQYVVPQPTPPNITREVTVFSAADARTESGTPGSRIICDFSDSIGAMFTTPTDVEFVMVAGRRVTNLEFANGFARVRVCSITPGVHVPTARLHYWRVANVNGTDLIIRDIDNTGGTDGAGLFNFGAERFAYVNNRMHADRGGILGMEGSTITHKDHVYAGNCMLNGDGADTSNSWTVRVVIRGAYIFKRNVMQGFRYHRIRAHPGDNTPRIAIDDNLLIDTGEASFIWVDAPAGNVNDGSAARCTYVRNNGVYMDGHVLGQPGSVARMEFASTNYGEYANNSHFRGSEQSTWTDASVTSTMTKSGSSYTTLGSLPSWTFYGGPGDPSSVSTT